MVKLSFRIYDNYRSSTKMESHGGTIEDSVKQLHRVVQQKYGVDIRKVLNDNPAPAQRMKHRHREDPINMFYDSPAKARRVRRRRGLV